MLDGPTSGTTSIPFFCAIATISAPGSAIAGQPASEIIPMECPSFSGRIMSGNIYTFVAGLEETTGGTDIFHDEKFYFTQNFRVVVRQHFLHGVV